MKKTALLATLYLLLSLVLFAQDEEEAPEKRNFKENLFTGGSISLAFYTNTFLVGGSPFLGYSMTNWADAGIVFNYNYTSYRDYTYGLNDKLRQSVYGGGAFIKLYPIRFLFVTGQFEHNYIQQKYIPEYGPSQKFKFEATSFLVGGGYTTGRQGRGGPPFFYLAVLFDINGDINSPYTDGRGEAIPIIKTGLQIPLFQGKGGD